MALVGVLMAMLDYWVPVWRRSLDTGINNMAIVLAAIALLPAIIAVMQMVRAKTSVHPHHQPEALVTNGIFALSRNPIYVTDLLLLTSLALWLGSLSPWLGPPLFVAVVTKRSILVEEQRLESVFGDSYRAYKARVRRWI